MDRSDEMRNQLLVTRLCTFAGINAPVMVFGLSVSRFPIIQTLFLLMDVVMFSVALYFAHPKRGK